MNPDIKRVSTRSRPKAAGLRQRCESACLCGFNTQPPEGGWNYLQLKRYCLHCFNTQPPEGGWLIKRSTKFVSVCFNTQPPEGGWVVFAPDIADWFMFQHAAARRRLAHREEYRRIVFMFQHAAARRRLGRGIQTGERIRKVSTRSRPKAAGCSSNGFTMWTIVSTRSRPKAAGSHLGKVEK